MSLNFTQITGAINNDSEDSCSEIWNDLERRRDVLAYQSFTLKVVVLTSYVIVSVVGALGNALVILAVLHNPLMRTPRNYFIINLAVSDLVMCTITAPFTLKISILDSYWDMGETSCKVVASLLGANIFVSNFSVIAIGLDRYLVILFPTNKSLQRLAVIFCFFVVWLASVSLALPLYFSNELKELQLLECDFRISMCGEDSTSYFSTHFKGVYYVGCFLVLYLIPLCTLGFFYGKILFRLKRRPNSRQKTVRQTSSHQKTFDPTSNQVNLHKLLISIVAAYGVCWFPLSMFNVLTSLDMSLSSSYHHTVMFACCYAIGMMSTCANPIIYGVLNANFRQEFRVLGRKFICRSAANDTKTDRPGKGILLKTHKGEEIRAKVELEEEIVDHS